MPRDLSIVKPRSYCPHCHQPIKFYQNIPLISFIIQKGKCAGCEEKISWRYPLVEFISGILTIAIFFIFGFSIDTIMYLVFCYALITVTFIDLDFRVIPDIISVGGIAVGIIFSFFVNSISWQGSLIGAAIGFVSFYLVSFVYSKITGKEGMGGGDVKLIAMIGAFLGINGVVSTIFFGSLAGVLYAVVLLIAKKADMKTAIPYGPFLSVGALLYVLRISYYLLRIQ